MRNISQLIESIYENGNAEFYLKDVGNSSFGPNSHNVFQFQVVADGGINVHYFQKRFDQPYYLDGKINDEACLLETFDFGDVSLNLAVATVIYNSFFSFGFVFTHPKRKVNSTEDATQLIYHITDSMLNLTVEDLIQMKKGSENTFLNLLLHKPFLVQSDSFLVETLAPRIEIKLLEVFAQYQKINQAWNNMQQAKDLKHWEKACLYWDQMYHVDRPSNSQYEKRKRSEV